MSKDAPYRPLILLFLALWLAACGTDAAGSAPPPTAIAAVSTTADPADQSSTPTDTPVPTATLLPPPPTTAPATATAIPTATLTPTPVVINSLEEFGPDRNPLTGELVTDTAVLQRRPIAVKISNNPPQYTRPQHGIGQADLVFEHVTETNISRFTAIFYGRTPPDIGPIRSARLIDKELPAMYDAAIAMSGSHPLVYREIANSDVGDRILREVAEGFYRTGDTSKPSEHTLHADPVGLWQELEEMGVNRAPRFTTSMAFDSTPPPEGDPATHVAIDYANWSLIEWDYDVESGRYRRTVDGETFIDGNNGEQVSAANVIILYVPHQFDREICIYHDGTTCSMYTTEIQLWGRGVADLIRDGKKYDVTWVRDNRSDMLTFIDDEGNPVPLQIGNTWFQVVPFYFDDPVIE